MRSRFPIARTVPSTVVCGGRVEWESCYEVVVTDISPQVAVLSVLSRHLKISIFIIMARLAPWSGLGDEPCIRFLHWCVLWERWERWEVREVRVILKWSRPGYGRTHLCIEAPGATLPTLGSAQSHSVCPANSEISAGPAAPAGPAGWLAGWLAGWHSSGWRNEE